MEEIAELIREIIEEKKQKYSPHPKSYGAPEGSKRDKELDKAKDELKSKDPEVRERAWRRRERMEKKEREKSGWENKPRPDTQTESVEDFEPVNEEFLELIRELIEEALSAKTKATLRKKAKKRGLTPGSVETEYKKGLAAWGTSGSRKGMSQHQWAMARVNAATPSKSWATVKKSKKKKKR
jgi:hypothetical protein